MRGPTVRIAVMLLVAWAQAPVAAAQGTPATPSPVTLEDYVAKNGIKDLAAIQFIALRCTSIYMFSSGMLREDNPKLAAQFEEAAKQFATQAFTTPGTTEEFVRDQVLRMSRMYSDRARAAKANTGNVFEDPLLRSDMFFCKKMGSK